MKSKRIIAVALSAALLVSVIAGCSKDKSSDETTAEETTVEEAEETEETTIESSEESEETSVTAETSETTEESEETTEATDTSDETTTSAAAEPAATTAAPSEAEATTLYMGYDVDEFMSVLESDGFQTELIDDDFMYIFNNPVGFERGFGAVNGDFSNDYFVFKFDTAQNAHAFYEYVVADEDAPYTTATENGMDVTRFNYDSSGTTLTVYYNEFQAMVVVSSTL